jgi:putative sulfotransferase
VQRFVIGTGRCGSTLLMKMLALHPDALAVFEFMNGLDVRKRFSAEPATAGELTALVSAEHPFVSMVLSRGYPVSEVTYPFGPGARFTREDPLPWLLVAVLPPLSEQPDALFDELMRAIAAFPTRPLREHYVALFEWLCAKQGKLHWIEKSGASLDFLPATHALYPDARFLHLHRDGREAALSMREHYAFRLAISLVYQLGPGGDTSHAGLSLLDPAHERSGRDPIREVLESRPPAELFGRFWSDQVARGYRGLPQLRPEQYLELRFEDLIAHPGQTLREIARFFELDPDRGRWIESASALVGPPPKSRFAELPPAEAERLRAACRTAQALLGREV